MVLHQRIDITALPASSLAAVVEPTILTRAERAHSRLSWTQRAERNARSARAAPLVLQLHGVPDTFARMIGLSAV